ncbi:ran guanine nucleotide release factor-like [Planoprotostelium fungivorum]|uniref:Ran guanine nucleotide release factor-like n=1 Tax=Planoprotostelium fungivorum TaxID=1890364 RepID=A0A2P6MZS4_9EUKA|nr:ran guanine nucleotide release factor-like [Planoprotostelium fungivorum]
MQNTPLWDGSIEVEVPSNYGNAANVRDVPDTQEVFLSIEGDKSIIFELLTLTEEVADRDAAQFYFQDLAEANDAQNHSQVLSVNVLTDNDMPHMPGVYKTMIVGRQAISKYKESARNIVDVYMCIIRLREQTTDIVITLNDPQVIHPESSSAPNAPQTASPSMLIFQHMLKTFNMKSLSLFG